jgi:spore coat protein A, manganese oxidase
MQNRSTLPKPGLAVIVGMLSLAAPVLSQTLLDPRTQPQFVNALPVPSIIDGRNGGMFTIGISQFEQWLGLVDPTTQQPLNTRVWGYNGSYPGPTIIAKKNVPIDIFWRNDLVNGNNQPLPHLLPVDATLHWALEGTSNWQQYGVPVVTHLHGGHTESASDGLPEAWFTPGFRLKGQRFVKGDVTPYHYSNNQEAATIWYHDHALGITRLNVYAGLAGYYLITDDNEINLQMTGKLPAAPYDLGLAIQDRMFTTDGQLFYPSMPEEPGQPDPTILPEFFGDFILVNGKTWPALEVEPRQYRFRVLNGSDSRFYNLFLSGGPAIQQIGSDNGLLPSAVLMPQMMIAPGERKDIIIDFSDPALAGQTIILRNNAKTPFPKGSAVNPSTTGRIMAFKITKSLDALYPLTALPAILRAPIVPLQTELAPRKLLLFEAEDEYDRLKPMLGTTEAGILNWHDPISENPALNSTEIWEIYNATPDAHPIHLHMVTMQLVGRQKFNARVDPETGKLGDIRLVGQPATPSPDEQGWKDTWVAYPGEVIRVIAKFDIQGLYVWHCHILSHEDHEMMRPFYVGQMEGSMDMDKVGRSTEMEKHVQLQMVPNPFSNYFTVRFELPATSMVVINMYDAAGRLVKKVQQGNMHQGAQNVNVDAGNSANGVYYCEVVINGDRVVKKMVLQK